MSLGAALQGLGLVPLLEEPLARHGYWRIGGPAEALVEVGRLDQLAAVLALGAPVTLLGNGSNSLIPDEGLRGVVIKLGGVFKQSEIVEEAGEPVVLAGAGLLNAVLLRRIDVAGLGGLAPLAGVPGTVGGAVRMNAGTVLGEIGAAVARVHLLLSSGEVAILPAEALGFSYRHAHLPPGALITRVDLRLRREGLEAERAAIAHHLGRRKATQPLELPSCGSVFKNPPGDYAGRLIESVGLRGHAIGGARISERHCNFIVNEGGARAEEVVALIALARQRVWEATGVRLEPEVHVLGPRSPWPPPIAGDP